MNYFSVLIKTAFEDLKRNKVRTFLTSLGILIGVMSVVLLIAFGIGLKNYIQSQFQSLGTDLVIVVPGKIISGGSFRSGPGALGGVHFDEADLLRLKRLNEASQVVPIFIKTITLSGSGKSEISDLGATTSDFFPVRNLEIDKGRLFTGSDVEKRAKVAVIGPKIAAKLFGNIDSALGKTVRVENQGFTVVGVLKSKGGGGLGGPDLDSFTYVPYKSALSFNPDKKFVGIYLKAKSEAQINPLKSAVKRTLLKRYKDDDFSVVELTEIQNAVTSIFAMLNSVLVAIGSISLLVGGIGIMNIMYASITERTREIGIRRAIGAKRNDILYQFLTEAVILSVFGGLLGLGVSLVLVLLIQPLFPAAVSPLSVVVALGVSSLIGVFFGVFPARRAANLSPIDAIRYE